MEYIENIINENHALELEKYLLTQKWTWGFLSKTHPEGSIPHWSIIFAGISKPHEKVYQCENELEGIIKNIWEELKPKFFADDFLVRSYANAITQGLDQRIHTDDFCTGSKTLILYVNKTWNVDWAGETIVWDRVKREINGSFLPKFRQGLLIDGSAWHGVRPVSSYCNQLRMTLMFKTRPKNYFD